MSPAPERGPRGLLVRLPSALLCAKELGLNSSIVKSQPLGVRLKNLIHTERKTTLLFHFLSPRNYSLKGLVPLVGTAQLPRPALPRGHPPLLLPISCHAGRLSPQRPPTPAFARLRSKEDRAAQRRDSELTADHCCCAFLTSSKRPAARESTSGPGARGRNCGRKVLLGLHVCSSNISVHVESDRHCFVYSGSSVFCVVVKEKEGGKSVGRD